MPSDQSARAAYRQQQKVLQDRLSALEGVLSEWRATASRADFPQTPALMEIEESCVELRRVLAGDLITIGFIGPFSSGKSLLASALLGQVTASMDSDGRWTWDTSLLPTDTRPTTSHPLEIRWGASSRFLVRYDGASGFVELPVTKEVVRSHVSNLYAEDLPPGRTVAQAILETPDAPLPGRFVDLPGTQSPRAEDDEVIAANLDRADCFVFVLSATRAIDSQALSQLDDLHELFLSDGKRVFFALTQIDIRLNRSSDGDYAWRSSQTENDAVLRQVFVDPQTGLPDEAFIGRGFIPVASPAAAKAAHLEAIGESDRVVNTEVREGSPQRLLMALSDFFYRDVAPDKLDSLSSQIDRLRDTLTAELSLVTLTLSAPLRQLEEQEASLDTYSQAIRTGRGELLSRVREVLESGMPVAFRGSPEGALEKELLKHLAPSIANARRVDDAMLERLPIAASTVATRWAKESKQSPLRRWQAQEDKTLEDAAKLVAAATSDAVSWGSLPAVFEDWETDDPSVLEEVEPERSYCCTSHPRSPHSSAAGRATQPRSARAPSAAAQAE